MARPGITYEVAGISQMIKSLNQAPNHIRKKTLGIAFGRAGKVFKDAAKRRAARRSGLMAKSIGAIRTKTKDKTVVRWKVHPKKGFRRVLKTKRDGTQSVFGKKASEKRIAAGGVKIVNPQRYAHLVELGTEHAKEHPFMKPAFDARERVALQKIKQSLKVGIEKWAESIATGSR